MQFHKDKIIIIDFGSQLTKLIARRVRDLGVYSEIITPHRLYRLKDYHNIKGFIFSGGPETVTKNKFQSVPSQVFDKKIPILGICYGLQLISKLFGGRIKGSKKEESLEEPFYIRKNLHL